MSDCGPTPGMNDLIKVRLQGGRFDGARRRIEQQDAVPVIYVQKCAFCGSHWWDHPTDRSDPYRRDEVDDRGYLVYIYTDDRLTGGPERAGREMVPAGNLYEMDDDA